MKRKKGDKYFINTEGGAYVGGNVNTGGGNFVGRDKIDDDYDDAAPSRERRKRSGGSDRRRQARIDDLNVHWDLLGEKLKALEKQHILETRADEKLRLQNKIDEALAERDKIERELDRLEGRG